MKIATYNVNGVNGRLPVLLRWLAEDQPDIVVLQELKAPQDKFPEGPIRDLGYDAIWYGQKSWNGVAMLSRVGDKWTVLIVKALEGKPRRFNELKREIGGISQQMLTRTLKTLERDGMVSRTVHPTVPPQVEYSLTELGHSLSEPVMRLGDWVGGHLDEIEANRDRYDEAIADAA